MGHDTSTARQKEIFIAAMDIADAAEQARFLDEACGDDASLRGRVEVLLQADADAGAFLELPKMEGESVRHFGDCVLLDVIAHGGMGAVYRARQEALERDVAVKVMTRAAGSPEAAARFRREALVLSRLEHPNIVPIHDLGTDEDGQLYYTMKLVKGRTLQDIINGLRKEDGATEQHGLASLLTVFRKVCDALAFAHSQGILHRDLKPANIMVGEFGEVLVMDWGLAKIQGATDRIDLPEQPELPELGRTLAGSVMGTPQYMSPEQARGENPTLDARSDVFSLGGILYAILTLHAPVQGTTLAEILGNVRSGNIPPPTSFGAGAIAKDAAAAKSGELAAMPIKPVPHTADGRVPAALSAVTMKALRVEKERRYQSVAEFSADIEAYQGGFATSAERAGAIKQLKLLMLRHKAVTAALAAMLVLSVGFVLKVMASERKATKNAEIARANEKLIAEHAEQARRSLAQTRIALADAAATNLDAAAMRHQLDNCPADLRDDSWRYLDGKVDSSVAALAPSAGSIFRSVFRRTGSGVADGEFLLTAEQSPFVFAVRPETGEIKRRLNVGIGLRKEIGLSQDGKEFAVAASSSLDCRIFDAETGAERFRLQESESGFFTHVSLSPDGARIILLRNTRMPRVSELRCVDRATKEVVWRVGGVQSAFASRDGRLLALNAANAVQVIKAENGEVVSKTEPSRAFLWSLAFNHDNTLVAAADYFGFATVSEVATGRRQQSFRVTNGRLTGVAFTDGGELVTLGQVTDDLTSQRVIQVWSLERLVALDTVFVPAEGKGKGNSLSLDSAGGWICAPGSKTKFWHTPLREQRTRINTGNACPFLFFLGDDHLVTSHHSSKLNFWNLKSDPPKPLPPLPDRCNQAAVNKAGNRAIFGIQNEAGAFVATLSEAGAPVVQYDPWEFTGAAAALNDAGDEALTGRRESLCLYVSGRPQPLREVALEGVTVWNHVAFADGGKKIIGVGTGKRKSSGEEDVVACWDRDSGALLHRIDHPALIAAFAISPDRRYVAYAGTDKKVFLVAVADFHLVRSFRAHDRTITAMAWHPSQPILATVSDDVSCKLWNPNDGTLIGRTLGISRSIQSVAFSPSGEKLAIGTADECALIYDTVALLRTHQVRLGSSLK